MKIESLHDLFVHELRDIYYAERLLVKALKKMAKTAKTPALRKAFEGHLTETEHQIERLESVFAEVDLKPKGHPCEAMIGLIEEGKTIMEECEDEATCDAGLIAAAQKVEHYEIATYGTLATWAKQLGLDHAAELLGETLDEEKAADEKLTSIAESRVNESATGGRELVAAKA